MLSLREKIHIDIRRQVFFDLDGFGLDPVKRRRKFHDIISRFDRFDQVMSAIIRGCGIYHSPGQVGNLHGCKQKRLRDPFVPDDPLKATVSRS